MMQTEFREESLVIAQQLKVHAEARGLTPGQFATAWVLANPIITSVIAGPRTLAQFEDYFGAMNVIISPEEEAMVDALVTPGHASTHGYNDPNYPFAAGRYASPGRHPPDTDVQVDDAWPGAGDALWQQSRNAPCSYTAARLFLLIFS